MFLNPTGPSKPVDDGTAIWGDPQKFQKPAPSGSSGSNFNQPRNQQWGNEGKFLVHETSSRSVCGDGCPFRNNACSAVCSMTNIHRYHAVFSFCTLGTFLMTTEGPPAPMGGPSQQAQGSSWGVPPPNRAPGSGQWAEANITQNNRNNGKLRTYFFACITVSFIFLHVFIRKHCNLY